MSDHELERQADEQEPASPAQDEVSPVDERDEPVESAGAGETWLEPWDRLLAVSKTRSGKSTMLLTFASYATRSAIVLVDVKRRYHFPGATVVRGVDELVALDLAKLPWPWRIHFVPVAVNSPSDRQAEEREWHVFFAWCAAQTDLLILLDECVPKPAPANGAPGSLELVLGQKKVDRVGVWAATGRWRGMARALISHADHILLWPGGLSVDELDDAAREMALGHEEEGGRRVKPTTELRGLLDQAKASGPFACLWWDRNRDTFRIVPALPDHLRDRAIADEISP